MKMQLCLLILGLFIFSACSTVPYNPRRSVKIQKKWYGYEFSQGNNVINVDNLAENMERIPKHREAMKDFRSANSLSRAMMILGSFGIAWSLGGGFDESTTLIASILLGGGGFYLDHRAREKLIPNVREQNQTVYDYRISPYQISKYKKSPMIFPLYSKSF